MGPTPSGPAAQLEAAKAHHQAGRLAEAERGYRHVLATRADDPQALYFLGVLARQTGRADEAIATLGRLTRVQPRFAEGWNVLGTTLGAAGRSAEAADAMRRVLELEPAHRTAPLGLGMALLDAGDPAAAISPLETAEARSPGMAQAPFTLGNALLRCGRLAEAADAYRRAIALAPHQPPLHLSLAAALAPFGSNAAASARRAVALAPGAGGGWLALARALLATGATTDADRARRHAPADDPDALCLATEAALLLGRAPAAESHARAALRVAPGSERPFRLLGSALLEQDRLDAASAHFLDPLRVLRRPGGPADHPTFRHATPAKLRHDLEQLAHLSTAAPDAVPAGAADAFRTVLDRVEAEGGDGARPLPAAAPALFTQHFNRLLHLAPAPALPGSALDPRLDREAIRRRFADWPTGACVIDDLLSPDALASLRRFCLESTIWFQSDFANEVGTSLTNGFAAPLVLQIAHDVKRAFPEIVGDRVLGTCWAYMYHGERSGLALHADPGEVSLNLWITPDSANLDPDGGGLTLWNKPVPAHYARVDAAERKRIGEALIAEPDARTLDVPYRCNRAILFNAFTVHRTQPYRFAPGYGNHRINVTFLFNRPGR